jgi:hypothetical protein
MDTFHHSRRHRRRSPGRSRKCMARCTPTLQHGKNDLIKRFALRQKSLNLVLVRGGQVASAGRFTPLSVVASNGGWASPSDRKLHHAAVALDEMGFEGDARAPAFAVLRRLGRSPNSCCPRRRPRLHTGETLRLDAAQREPQRVRPRRFDGAAVRSLGASPPRLVRLLVVAAASRPVAGALSLRRRAGGCRLTWPKTALSILKCRALTRPTSDRGSTSPPPPSGDFSTDGGGSLRESGRQDLNLRPLAPQASALPGCATPRGKRVTLSA